MSENIAEEVIVVILTGSGSNVGRIEQKRGSSLFLKKFSQMHNLSLWGITAYSLLNANCLQVCVLAILFDKRDLVKYSKQSVSINQIFSTVVLYSQEILCFELGFVFCIWRDLKSDFQFFPLNLLA